MARERKRPEDEAAPVEAGDVGDDADELNDEDFQFVLRELLAAYEPILAEALEQARAPDALTKDALEHPPSCDEELQLAERIFERFCNEKIALRLLPPEGREQLGSVESWQWCLRHICCCIKFGWLVCRGPRTFRAHAYYLYRYWLCVRQALGDAPVGRALTEEEREDFNTLVQALAGAFKPYLTDQLATVEFPFGLSDEIVAGQVDCDEGAEESAAIFERLLTVDIAPALLGRKEFEAHRDDPNFWFCRCWCLCAIRFGCCLARARSLRDVVRCLQFYRRCLRHCFQPLRCDITAPHDCAVEQTGLLPMVSPLATAVQIEGTASGSFFGHYELQWRKVQSPRSCDDDTDFSSVGIHYPGGGPTGSGAVTGGVLGWLDTSLIDTALYEVRVCVFSTQGGRTCCCGQFMLFKRRVWIDGVTNIPAPVSMDTPLGPFDENAQVDNTTPGGTVVPVGGYITVTGNAWVGDCNDRKIKCVDIRAAVGWNVGPDDMSFASTLPLYTTSLLQAPICYDDVDEKLKRAWWNKLQGFHVHLTRFWHKITLPPDIWVLEEAPWPSHAGLPLGVMAGPCPDPQHRCRSGQYTLLLDVSDTTGEHYYDTQQVWFDNKPMDTGDHVVFAGLEGLSACSDMSLGKFIPAGAPCGIAWPINLLGIAYDELIDESDTTYPSDNFDYYSLTVTRQGGPAMSIPIVGPPADPGNPFKGITRRGQPGTRCDPVPAAGPMCPPAQLVPGQSFDVLTALDLRVFDAVCVGSVGSPYVVPSGFALKRGECCGYTFQLYAQDKTWSDGYAGGLHHAWSLPWAVCICNDLKKQGGDVIE